MRDGGDRLRGPSGRLNSLPDGLVRAPGAFAAEAIGFVDSRIVRASRTIAFAPPQGTFAASIDARTGSFAGCAEPARTIADATTAFGVFHGSLSANSNSKNSLEKEVHELAYPMLSSFPSGRRS